MSVPFVPPTPQPVGRRVGRSVQRQLPALIVLACVVAGLAVVASHHFRRGTFVIGASLLLHALFRALLAERHAGWLAVRTRWTDVAVSALFGGALVALTLNVPAPT